MIVDQRVVRIWAESTETELDSSSGAASPPAAGDHAGYNETSFLMATRPELVEQDRLGDDAPWYCRQQEKKNSWTANVAHGEEMVDAVVDAWVAMLEGGK